MTEWYAGVTATAMAWRISSPLREQGTTEMLDSRARYLTAQPAS